MGIALFEFVFETLRQRLNQPSNARFWLPARLDAIAAPGGGPLLPLHETAWSLGTIGGPTGADLTAAFTGQWLILLNYKHRDGGGTAGHQAIACPADPLPRLSLPEVTVAGLDNVMILPGPQVTEPSGAGYRAILTAKFNAYDAAHPPARSPLALSGTYDLTLCVCTAPSAVVQPTACDGWESTVIEGSGLFAVSFSDTFADITMTLGPAVDGKGGVTIGVERLVVRGPTPGSLPTLSVDQLTVVTKASWLADNVWLPKATEALESPQGRAALVGNLNAALNEPGNRGQLATVLTSRLNDIFDGALGAVPSGGLPATGAAIPNPVDQLLFERFAATINDPASAYFVPRLVRASGSPALDPLTLSDIALPDVSVAGVELTGVELTALDATGLSNAAAPPAELCLRPWGVETTLGIATLDPPPTVTIEIDGHDQAVAIPAPPLTVVGQFQAVPSGSPQPLTGSARFTAQPVAAYAQITMAGADLDHLVIGFQEIVVSLQAANGNLAIVLGSSFDPIINQLVNTPANRLDMVVRLNSELATQRAPLGARVTAAAKATIAARLDGDPAASSTRLAQAPLPAGRHAAARGEELTHE